VRDTTDIPPIRASYEDDPQVVKEAATEDYSLHVVPSTWRSSRGSLSMAWYSMYSAMFWLVIAGTIALAVGTVNTIIGIVLAVIFFGVINHVITGYATETGQTVALFSRSIFGYVGAALATLIFAATAIYYGVFEGSVIAIALHEYFGGLSLNLWYLVVVLYSVPLVFGGVQVWLDRFNGVLLPFYCIGLIAAVVWAIAEFGYSGRWLSYKPESMAAISGPGWLFAFTAYMGVSIMMMFTWDFARFGRREDRAFHGAVTFGPFFYTMTLLVNGVIGIFLAHTIKTQGALSEISVVLGLVSMMGLAGVALIWVSQTRINTANFYLASSNLQSFFARAFKIHMPRTTWAVIAGAIVYAIMLTNVFSFILDALRYQGVFIVAWVGIALTHILSARVKAIVPEPEFRPGRVPLVNPGGLLAWFVSAAVGITLIEAAGAWGATWSAPITFVLSAAIYGLSLTVARRSWFVLERPYDPRDEVDDVWAARVTCAQCEKRYVAVEMDRDPENGHQPICAACASESPTFYRHARRESQQAAGREPAVAEPAPKVMAP
jgi:purine-cytosine permease-like protein